MFTHINCCAIYYIVFLYLLQNQVTGYKSAVTNRKATDFQGVSSKKDGHKRIWESVVFQSCD